MKNLIVSLLVVFLFAGCRDVREVNTYQDLNRLQLKGVEVVTIDSCVYDIERYTMNDSSITVVEGVKIKNYNRENFMGDIPFNRMAYIQTGDEEMLAGWMYLGAAAIFIAGGDVLTENGLRSRLIFPTGEGSCPFLYSWNGSEYVLQGETFGVSLGRSLESETMVVLSDSVPEEEKIKIKFTNERPETHYFNTIKLFAVEVDENTSVYSDNRNSLKAVTDIRNIISSWDARGNDLTDKLIKRDNNYWNSDLSSANFSGGYEDVIYALVDIKGPGDSVALLISSMNTGISTVLFKYLRKELGNDFASFIRAAETDAELTLKLKDILFESALKIDIWNGSEWKYIDAIYPEANVASFQKLVKLPADKNIPGGMKIRLRALTDVWKIDQVCTGISSSLQVLAPELLYSSRGTADILLKDQKYSKLIPGEEITLEYKGLKPHKGKKIVYAVKAGGYLYEYIIRTGSEEIAGLDMLNPDFPKLGLMKMMLENRNLYLPIIYNEWRNERTKM